MDNTKKYIGESPMKENPQRKLKIKLTDGAVTTDKIADKSVTMNKIGDDVARAIQGGERYVPMVSPELGNGTDISVSQKTITEAFSEIFRNLNNAQPKLTFDSTPKENSNNPVTSEGIKAAVDAKADANNTYTKSDLYTKTEVDNLIDTITDYDTTVNVVSSLPSTGQPKVIYRLTGVSSYADYAYSGGGWVKLAEYSNLIDDAPVKDSDNLAKSGGIYTKQKQISDTVDNRTLTVDSDYLARIISSTSTTGAILRDGYLEAHTGSNPQYRKWIAAALPENISAGDSLRLRYLHCGDFSSPIRFAVAFFHKEVVEGVLQDVEIGDAYIEDNLSTFSVAGDDAATYYAWITVPEGATHVCMCTYAESSSRYSNMYIYNTTGVREEIDDLQIGLSEVGTVSGASAIYDLTISDENENDIVRFSDGHIQTKNFNSKDIAYKAFQWETKYRYDVECVMPMEPYEEGKDSYSTISNTKAVGQYSKIYDDRAALYLPDSYDPNGEPVRLVIFGRQGGGTFTDESNFAKTDVIGATTGNYIRIVPYLLYLGYAVLAIDGTPDDWAAEITEHLTDSDKVDRFDGWANGSYVSVRSAKIAYDKAIKDYNIRKDGVFGYGYSQGGWMIMNIAELSGIPFLAVILKSPVISMNSYFGASTGGTVTGDNGVVYRRYKYYMLKQYYDIDPAEEDMSLEEFNAIPEQPWRWAGYDPFLRYAEDIPTTEEISAISENNTSEDVQQFTMKRHCHFPVKIWVAKNDNEVGFRRQSVLVQAIRNAGCWADARLYQYGGHGLMPSSTSEWSWPVVGTFNYRNTNYELLAPTYEMAIFLSKFGGQPVVYDLPE